MIELSIDFETHSQCPITQEGAYRYAMHPSTGIYNMGWAFGDFEDDDVEVWYPGQDFPQAVIDHILAGGTINAWNATFERLIFKHVLCRQFPVPEPALEQFHCTAARARAHGMPGKLADAVRCLDLPVQKQPEGLRLIREYSANNVPWDAVPDEDKTLWDEYVRGDIITERMVGSVLRQLTPHEWEEYHINETINDRGIPVDLPMARAALGYAQEVRAEVDGKIAVLTEYAVTTSRKRKTRDQWLLPQLNADQLQLITKTAATETEPAIFTFDQAHRDALIVEPDLPEPVLRYLELLDEAGGATISKYSAMTQREVDGRIPGCLLYNGAGQTGRFSSTGLQMHNLRRDSFDDPEPSIADLLDGYELDEVTTTLARLVRSAVHNPGGLSWFDYSAVEGRVAPWLAHSHQGEAKLALYRKGVDPYVYNAARTFRVDMDAVDKTQRQAGKLQELALQFLGGVGALKLMARNYKLHFTDTEAQYMVDAWREVNPWARRFGDELDAAALRAVGEPGTWFRAGRVRYAFDGGDWLWCELPSGRLIAYGKPRREMVETPWGDERLAVTCLWGARKPKRGEDWPRRPMHGGLWIENVTQGTAADLLRDAAVRADDAGLDIVLHVHDEIVVEGRHTSFLGELMLDSEPWADGLPLAGDGGSGFRYGK